MNYVDLMKADHKDLSVKINSLKRFIYEDDGKFDKLDKITKHRIIKQLNYMEGYLNTLYSRIWTEQ